MTLSSVHRAGWVMADAHTFIENGAVHVCDGKIISVDRAPAVIPVGATKVDHGPGVLMPALINAHTHLELSALEGQIPSENGFIDWIRGVIAGWQGLSPEVISKAATSALKNSHALGVGAVGDIASPGSPTWHTEGLPMAGIRFLELLGNADPPKRLPSAGASGLLASWAGHAPHTTSPTVLQRSKAMATALGRPYAIHVAESEEEDRFVRTGDGPWAEFLAERNLELMDWQPSKGGPIAMVDDLRLLDPGTIVVHALATQKKDWDILANRRAWVCLCPRSNQQLHGRRPTVAAMADAGIQLCLGTDSLASCDSLSILDEISALHIAETGIPAANLLAMATENGASALGLSRVMGRLAPGFRAAMVYIPLESPQPATLAENIVANGSNASVSAICDSNSNPTAAQGVDGS